ncbi:MAG: hypothetical protein JWM86_245, partial [Thermoleophilia bacterium]|nr:hypothetical protein [Thermoleophilia bacterium]
MTRDLGVWARLESQLGLVALRPRLSSDVRVRRIGDDAELVQVGTRRVLSLAPEEVPVVERFDGEQTIAELIVAGIGAGQLAVEPVLSLVDRLVRAEMLDQYPPNLYRQLDNHLASLTRERTAAEQQAEAEAAPPEAEAAPEAEPIAATPGPWRA